MAAKFALKLLRNDEVVADMISIGNNDFSEEPVFTRPSFLETTNDIKIQYARRIVEEE